MAYIELALGATLPVVFIIQQQLLLAAAFRPDRPAEGLLTWNDAG